MCTTTGLTVGRVAAAQQDVTARMESAGSRHLSITDAKSIGFMSAATVTQASGFSAVERAVGFATTIDTVNAATGVGGTRVPAVLIVGDVRVAVTLIRGRWPRPGEALISVTAQSELGLDEPLGAITTATDLSAVRASYPIVGSFAPRDPFAELEVGLVVAAPPDATVHRLDVISTTATDATDAQAATLALLNRADPTDLTVTSPETLAQVQTDVLGALANYNQSLVILVQLAGGILVAVVALADVLIRRTEIGRRRALGAPRWALTTILITRAMFAALAGALIGTVATVLVVTRTGQHPDPTFTIATAVLALVATTIATTLPALAAARQDPVHVLRTP